jgi:hypothetical protein
MFDAGNILPLSNVDLVLVSAAPQAGAPARKAVATERIALPVPTFTRLELGHSFHFRPFSRNLAYPLLNLS